MSENTTPGRTPIRFRELTARRNYPRGVPEGVDPESRLYVPGVRLTARGEDWEGVLAFTEYYRDPDGSGEVTVITHLFLTHGGFDRDRALGGLELFAPERVPVVARTARYRRALQDYFEGKGFEVMIDD